MFLAVWDDSEVCIMTLTPPERSSCQCTPMQHSWASIHHCTPTRGFWNHSHTSHVCSHWCFKLCFWRNQDYPEQGSNQCSMKHLRISYMMKTWHAVMCGQGNSYAWKREEFREVHRILKKKKWEKDELQENKEVVQERKCNAVLHISALNNTVSGQNFNTENYSKISYHNNFGKYE